VVGKVSRDRAALGHLPAGATVGRRDFNSTIFVEANGVTHHGFGTLFILAQTYLARIEETDDQSAAIPFITSFNSTTQGHLDVSRSKFLGLAIHNCTQVTYTLNVTNCDAFAACMTQAVV
jgi:hypothetical protein